MSFDSSDYNALKEYLKSISKFEALTEEKEFGFFRELELLNIKLLKDDLEVSKQQKESLIYRKKYIENRLYESCAKFVVFIAKRYLNKGLPLFDLIQEGNIGLLFAIEKFDVSKGFRLTTYSFYWIRQAITRAIHKKSRIIKLPTHIYEKIYKIESHQRVLRAFLNRDPSIKELSESMNISVEYLNHILSFKINVSSIDINIFEDSDSSCSVVDAMEDKDFNLEEETVNKICSKRINRVVSNKIPNQRNYHIIEMRFGLNGFKQHTLEEIGKKVGITRERVRQIESRTLKGLKNNKELQELLY